MKSSTVLTIAVIAALLTSLYAADIAYCQLKAGQSAPLFTTKDTNGKQYDLANMTDQPMLILYFFDVDSPSSQEGLLNLDDLVKKYTDENLFVWGITRATSAKAKQFMSKSKLTFPVLIDSGEISTRYSARMILPTVCIIGPDLHLLDYIQGGGKTTEHLLVTLAERSLQNRQTNIAKALSDEVVRKDPENVRAKSVKGYAALKEGDLKTAEKAFYKLSRQKGEGEIIGKEGLSQVYARKGEPEKAMSMAKEVEKKSTQRAYAHVVKGDLLYSQNKTKAAEAEYRKAIASKGGNPGHRAVAYNQLGRIYAVRGDYKQSLELYDHAVALDPYYVEATSNKGMTYERQGEWDKALEAYRKAEKINKSDPFTTLLATNAQRMMLIEKDPEERAAVEKTVTAIVDNYKRNAAPVRQDSKDPWTSGTTVLTIFDPTDTGGLSLRDGFARMLSLSLADQLKDSGRVEVTDPIVLERVVAKLGLASDKLAEQEIQRRLARACGATLMSKGTLFHLAEGALLKFELVDTQTNERTEQLSRQFASTVTLRKDLHWLNREVLTNIMVAYPLQAFVVEVSGNRVLMNLGKAQGVVAGARFDVVEEKPVREFKGKVFKPEPAVMATVEVVRVDAEFSYAHIKDQRRPVVVEDKLRENPGQLSGDTQKTW